MSVSNHKTNLADHFLTRRDFLARCGMGLGLLGLANLVGPQILGAVPAVGGVNVDSPLAPRASQFPGKAKRVIHIFANGGPSHVDTFDPKPSLAKFHGQPLPMEYLATERRTGAAFQSPFKFKKYGQSGIEVSDLFPHVGECIDDIAVIRSMYADVPNHEPSLLLMNCGEARLPRPSMGSWVTYGLGTENQNLPGFISICPGMPNVGPQLWSSAYLPSMYQGTYVPCNESDPEKMMQHLVNRQLSPAEQRRELELVNALNKLD